MMKKYISIVTLLCLTLTNQTSYSKTTVTPQYCNINGGQLEYYRFGSGTPIVLIAGYASDVTSWSQRFLDNLAKHHDVIVFNNRNVGKSTVNQHSYTTAELADDTDQLIKQLNLKQPAVIGISMGGMIAQHLAIKYPNDIGKLILINTAMSGKKATYPDDATIKLMLNLPTSKLGFYWVAVNHFFPSRWRLRMSWKLIDDRFLPNERTEIDLERVMTEQHPVLLAWMKDDSLSNQLNTVSSKALVLNGIADQIIPPDNSLKLMKAIPHARLVRFEEGGHAMIYQYPEEMAEVIESFLNL